MKQISQKIASFVMACVVLFSTLSFTLNRHYCGKTLVETAIFQKVKGCGMDMSNPVTKDCIVSIMNCCSDEQVLIDGQDELQLKIDKLSFEQQVFLASYVQTYVTLFEGLSNSLTSYKAYKPPLVIKDLYKIDETYLI